MTTRLAAAACALLAGCATVTTLIASHSPEGLADDMPCIPRIYSGVAGDVALLRSDHSEKELVVFDLPFSLVADTLVLPYTIYGQVRYGNICPVKDKEPPPEADPFEPIRERIRKTLSSREIPSISVAVAREDRIVWEESFGWADREGRIAATPNTMYTLGSAAKPMTATAIMLLHRRGLIDLDRPVNDYLGAAKIVACAGDEREATVRRVAQHNAGLPGYYETFYPDEPAKPPAMDDLMLRYGKIVFPPGERFVYSNLDYGILGHVIARVSGKDYATFMYDEVFEPLGMTRSSATVPAGAEKAVRYFLDGARLADYTTPHPAASDVYASVHDLVLFGMLHAQSLPRLDDRKPVLSPADIDEMQTPAIDIGGGSSYGIGWVLSRDAKGRRIVSHGGAAAGVDAQLTLLPEESVVVAVLVNKNEDQRVSAEIADAILAVIFGDAPGATADSRAATETAGAGLPGALLGIWAGTIRTPERDLPVTLAFDDSGAVEGRLGDQPPARLREARFENGIFTGRMSGDIGTPDANRRPYDLDWSVTLRGDALSGALYAIGHHPSRGVLLGYWTSLERRR